MWQETFRIKPNLLEHLRLCPRSRVIKMSTDLAWALRFHQFHIFNLQMLLVRIFFGSSEQECVAGEGFKCGAEKAGFLHFHYHLFAPNSSFCKLNGRLRLRRFQLDIDNIPQTGGEKRQIVTKNALHDQVVRKRQIETKIHLKKNKSRPKST